MRDEWQIKSEKLRKPKVIEGRSSSCQNLNGNCEGGQKLSINELPQRSFRVRETEAIEVVLIVEN